MPLLDGVLEDEAMLREMAVKMLEWLVAAVVRKDGRSA